MQFDMDYLRHLRDEHLLSLVPDPHSDLVIANYGPKAQYGRAWDEHPVLLDCRGTILQPDGTVWAKSYKKFFNPSERPGTSLEELAAHGEPDIAHKMDGSLIVAFRDPATDAIRFATRGSFTSEQAIHAARIWKERHSHVRLDEGNTFLFELVAPYNRIVVAYPEEALVLIGIVHTFNGHEYTYGTVTDVGERLGLPTVRVERGLDWRNLATYERANFEGFVLHWPRVPLRIKAKLADYVRLHRIVTGMNERTLWEMLARGDDLASIKADLPDELYPWVDRVAGDLIGAFHNRLGIVQEIVRPMLVNGLDPADRAQRKVAAAHIVAHAPADLRGACFARLDGKDYSTPVWRSLEPKSVTVTPVAARAEG